MIERDKALRVWRTARGPEDMARHQAQYNAMQSIIDFIMVAPAELPR